MSGEAAESGVGVGSLVAGTYEIVRMLGRGGMGAVWEAHHSRLPGKRVAIKVLHASVADDPEALARFRREAEIACRLGHSNIVEVHDFNKLEDGSPYLILELLEGESLDDRLRKGALSIADCEAYLRQIGSALQCAHAQGVVHRDLKPQNIFLVPSPAGVGPDVVKVLDFGISKIRGSQTVKTQDSTLLGTPQYMAPEQAVGQHDKVDARTDIFALGAMLYELLSGKPAFAGQNIPEVVYKVVHVEEAPLSSLVADIPVDKAAAIHKALSKAQDDRFATVDELVLAFTGEPLPPLRVAGTARVASESNAMLASAATVDSSKIDMAKAATVDSSRIDMAKAATVASHSSEMPAVTGHHAELGAAATIDSSKLDRDAVAPFESQQASPSEAVPQPRSRVRLIALALALLGVAGTVFAFTRDKADRQPSMAAPPSLDAASPIVAMTTTWDASMPDAALADAGVPDASVPDAGKAIRKHRPVPEGQPTKEVIPTDVARLLQEAQSHLKSGRTDKAIAVAREANRQHPTTRGYLLQAAAFCRKGDLTSFNGALGKVPPAKQRAARIACKKFNR